MGIKRDGARLHRRQMLSGGLASLAAACASGSKGQAAADPLQLGQDVGQEFVIRGGHVLTMDPKLGDLPKADVYINQGIIYQVGVDLEVPSTAYEVDASNKIVLPGFVDTHSHLWLTQMRGLFGQDAQANYFPVVEALGRVYSPEDMAVGTELGALECLYAGITTVCEYCDNVRTPAHAEAALAAIDATGIRYRFIYGPHDDMPEDQPIDLAHVKKLVEAGPRPAPEALRSLGVGVRLPEAGSDGDHTSAERARREVLIARSLELPISAHASGQRAPGQLEYLRQEELLGEDLLLVHASGADPKRLTELQEAGVGIALTPISEQRVGFGVTRLSDFAPYVTRLGLGCDGNALSGAADMFAVMQMLHNVEVGSKGEELSTLPRAVLELATSGGARTLGLFTHAGSLVPGKRADMIVVNTRSFNTVWSRQGDPAALLVYSASPHNVDAVWVDGKLVKYDGRLLGVDEERLFERAEASIWAVRQRATGS